MEKVWIKLTKYFRGGSREDYKLVDPESIKTKDQQEELMGEWGENSEGGKAYGFTVRMDFLEAGQLPPKEWFVRKIAGKKAKIQLYKKTIVEMKKDIVIFEEILKTLK